MSTVSIFKISFIHHIHFSFLFFLKVLSHSNFSIALIWLLLEMRIRDILIVSLLRIMESSRVTMMIGVIMMMMVMVMVIKVIIIVASTTSHVRSRAIIIRSRRHSSGAISAIVLSKEFNLPIVSRGGRLGELPLPRCRPSTIGMSHVVR